ncbi:MAG: type I DNA topoisomerase, partial [Bacteroidota bacterium]
MKRLVVVESPTKARTISKFLPADAYQIEACMGHVRDLPSSAKEIPESVKKEKWSRLGVNVNDGFTPLYIVPPEKKKVVTALKKALKDADELYVATDEDREGESIGWHLLQVLNPKVPVRRMVFHEITREAIERAVEDTRDIDLRLVDAQETRRILDRLVGYTISPLLWKKIRPKLSAGRVQSVAVRMLVGREQERLDFIPAGYWDLKATLAQAGQNFEAQMTHLGEERLASGKDFDENTGKLKEGTTGVLVLQETDARRLAAALPDAAWRITDVETKERSRKPAAPFITSTLQQEANRKLGLSARRTMQIAQALYEQGHITYMRTDSPTLSGEAIGAARSAVEKRYGKNYLSPSPRQYGGKVRNAQEAHEAIRPAGTAMKTQRELGLTGLDGKLYDLIWKRTVA